MLEFQVAEQTRRDCPICGNPKSNVVIRMSAQQILAANWSYRQDQLEEIGLDLQSSFTIEQCTNCKFVYAKAMPSAKFLKLVYDRLIDIEAARRESFSANNVASRMENLATLIRLANNPKNILDYGCGFGSTIALLKTVHGPNLVGFDTSSARVGEIKNWHSAATTSIADVEALAQFDLVILDNVLEHLPEPDAFVKWLAGICSTEAIIFVGVPDANSDHLRKQVFLSRNHALLSMDINPWEHLNYFDIFHLDRLFAKYAFAPIRQSELPEDVKIGLRPETRSWPRVKNAMATITRCVRYAFFGDALKSPNRRYYRRLG